MYMRKESCITSFSGLHLVPYSEKFLQGRNFHTIQIFLLVGKVGEGCELLNFLNEKAMHFPMSTNTLCVHVCVWLAVDKAA